jgi:hypothetical protein
VEITTIHMADQTILMETLMDQDLLMETILMHQGLDHTDLNTTRMRYLEISKILSPNGKAAVQI